jgi:hypothetical protein
MQCGSIKFGSMMVGHLYSHLDQVPIHTPFHIWIQAICGHLLDLGCQQNQDLQLPSQTTMGFDEMPVSTTHQILGIGLHLIDCNTNCPFHQTSQNIVSWRQCVTNLCSAIAFPPCPYLLTFITTFLAPVSWSVLFFVARSDQYATRVSH